MKLNSVLTGGALLALAACADQPTVTARAPEAAPLLAAGANGVEGRYLVILKEGADPASVAAVAGATPRHTYTSAINGFAATLNSGQLTALRHNPAVEYIEQDQLFEYTATQSGATWGLDRIDQRNLPLSGTYTHTATAGSVRAYIIDSGINPSHTQFGGRAAVSYDATGGNGIDCNGHGTHVAGTVGGSTYGVAKAVLLRAVRVGTCGSSLYTADIVEGIDWVRANHTKPAVANMSLGGGASSSINTATTNLINAGVTVVVAAGNSNTNACNGSPSGVTAAIVVAASTSTDARATYSNYGSCVDLYAPGSSITSAWYSSTTATNTISGTSMASPHVTGVAALYKATFGDASQATVQSWIVNNSTANVITGNITGTPNRLLYKSTL
ncbi:MAG TPA: S8 family peptidase [Longimicrobium sp.]|nr:S8 family peptidase [Longimicrobium sp.]